MTEVDVVVVGAGFAGLAAARDLVGGGRSVAVVEARDRVSAVGSATRPSATARSSRWAASGSGPPRTGSWRWPRTSGVETFPTYDTGSRVLHFGGRRGTYKGTIPRINPLVIADVGRAQARLESLAKKVPLDAPVDGGPGRGLGRRHLRDLAPAQHAHAARHGRCSPWASRRCSRASPATCRCCTCSSTPTRRDRSRWPIDTGGGAQQDRFVGGSQLLCDKMADALGPDVGDDSTRRCGASTSPATGSRWTSDNGTWTVPARDRVGAPAAGGPHRLRPALPPWRDQLTQRTPMGSVIKCNAIYDEPFWRAEGLSGQATGDGEGARVVFDNSPPDGSPGRPARLPRGRRGPAAGPGQPGGTAPGRARLLRALLRAQGRPPGRLRRARLAGRALERGLLRHAVRAQRVDPLRPCAARAGRARSTGPAPRPPRCGRATWTGRCPRAGAPRRRCWPPWPDRLTAAIPTVAPRHCAPRQRGKTSQRWVRPWRRRRWNHMDGVGGERRAAGTLTTAARGTRCRRRCGSGAACSSWPWPCLVHFRPGRRGPGWSASGWPAWPSASWCSACRGRAGDARPRCGSSPWPSAMIALYNRFTGRRRLRLRRLLPRRLRVDRARPSTGDLPALLPAPGRRLRLPLLIGMASCGHRGCASAALFVVPCCVLVGETVAWVGSRLRRSESANFEAEARFRSAFENAPIGMALASCRRTPGAGQPRLRRHPRARPRRARRHAPSGTSPIPTTGRPTPCSSRRWSPGTSSGYHLEKRYIHADGHEVWVTVSASCVRDDDGQPALPDRPDRGRHRAPRDARAPGPRRRARPAHRPPQPGAVHGPPRAGPAAAPSATHHSVALMFLDLDRFKLINDSLGPRGGRPAPRAVAHRLSGALRAVDTLARFGGDEFTVLCEVIDKAEALEIAERLVQAMQQPLAPADERAVRVGERRARPVGRRHGVRAPRCCATPTSPCTGPRRRARRASRSTAPTTRRGTVRRLRTSNELHRALERDELELHYQPMVDLHTADLGRAWRRWCAGTTPPGACFCPASSSAWPRTPASSCPSGSLGAARGVPPGGGVARRCATAAGQDPGRLNISVNVSAQQLADPAFPRQVAAALEDSGLDPDRLWLEITESTLMGTGDARVATLVGAARPRGSISRSTTSGPGTRRSAT